MHTRWQWILLAPALLLASCSRSQEARKDEEALDVLCSFFPMYVFTKNVVGETPGVNVQLMLPPEMGCPHDYDLTPNDMKKIASADVYVMNGAGLEAFPVDQILKANPDVVVIDTSKNIDHIHADHDHDHNHKGDEAHDHAHDDEKDGHEHDHDHEAHTHDDNHDHEAEKHEGHHSHEGGVNPHFFSSPMAAAAQVKNIADALAKADPKNAETYRSNANAYAARLTALGEEFKEAAKGFGNRHIVTVHEVFDYLARDCDLEIVATIHSEPGQDPSSAQMRRLVEEIREHGVAVVFIEPQYSSEVAKTIAKEAGVPVESLDPIASGPPDAPADYYETTMRKNLETLKRVLSK